MTSSKPELPGLAQIRKKFIGLLVVRQKAIATHTLAAWEGETIDQINVNLKSVQQILHQIAGSAGSLGLAELGSEAFACEASIITHLDGPAAHDGAECPVEIAKQLDAFVSSCQVLIESSADTHPAAPSVQPFRSTA